MNSAESTRHETALPPTANTTHYRVDIQALRGIAVLLVVAHHATLPLIRAGYLGVDIFFVVSGFVITTVVSRDIRGNSFSFVRFYWRRAWRLLPTTYATVAACIVASMLLLTGREIHDFSQQVWGAVSFTANIVLWLQTGYFERAAALKPLLHVWSLSLEEQYYLLLPALLALSRRSTWVILVALITTISLLACFVVREYDAAASFYLLPMRAWEMGLGSLGGLLYPHLGRRDFHVRRYIAPVSVIGIFCVVVYPLSNSHPGVDAVIACVATLLLLLFPSAWFSRGVIVRAIAWVGDRSYSLYLVHWPIFAFLSVANVAGGGLPWRIRIMAIFASLIGAYSMHRLVEQPFRRFGSRPIRSGQWWLLAGLAVMLGASATLVDISSRNQSDVAYRLRPNDGLNEACAYYSADATSPLCENSSSPKILVWGDSMAMQHVPGLVAEGAKLAQSTRPSCAPLWSLSQNNPEFTREAGVSCIRFNEQTYRRLAQMPTVETVVLSGSWSNHLGARLLRKVDGEPALINSDDAAVTQALTETIMKIRGLGKRVIIIAPPPSAGFDPGRCNERLVEGKWSFGGPVDCSIAKDGYEKQAGTTLAFLAEIERRTGVHVVRIADTLCDQSRCDTRWSDTLIYRDSGHLSHEGSVALTRRAGLLATIEALAR